MKVLDHGEVEVMHQMAADSMVLAAMLISTGKDMNQDLRTTLGRNTPYSEQLRIGREKVIERNKGRINYLMREHHGTPFEHNFFCFRVTAPIFVLREWHRHRIGWSYNEQSGRYMELGDKWYVPDEVRERAGKPGHYIYIPATKAVAQSFKGNLNVQCGESYGHYLDALEGGVAPEQARFLLHVNHYSSMYASCNARSLMNFLSLRANPTAQWEIQQYANALETIFAESMPVTYEAFVNNGRIAP